METTLKEVTWESGFHLRKPEIAPSEVDTGLKEIESRICPVCKHEVKEDLVKARKALLIEYAVRGVRRWVLVHKDHLKQLEQVAQVMQQLEIQSGSTELWKEAA